MIEIKSNKIITPNGLRSGYLYIDNGIIDCFSEKKKCADEYFDFNGKYVSPGFIDLHTHGAGGYTLYVVDYEKPEDRVVSFGSEHGLPTEIELTLNDGSKVTGTITWTGEYNKELAGTYRLEGIISYNGAIGHGSTIFDGIGDKITATVTVRDEIKIIKNFTKVADVRIKVGDEYSDKLATTFVLSVYSEYYKTTQEITVQILWSGKVNVLVPGTYTLTATPVGSYRFDENIDENILKVNVIVEETSSGSSSSDDESGCFSAASGAGLMSVIVLGMALVAFKKRKNNN